MKMVSNKVKGAAIELHRNIGPGLLESAYENALAYDLKEIGFEVLQQVPMPSIYKEVRQEVGYRIDILVNNKVIIFTGLSTIYKLSAFCV